MPGWMDSLTILPAYAALAAWAKSNPGKVPSHGQAFAGKVFDAATNTLIDPPNANDPEQQTNWAGNRSVALQSELNTKANELIDPTSKYNQGLFGLYQRMAMRNAPSADQTYGLLRAGGITGADGGAMATLKAREGQLKAADSATNMWRGQIAQNYGVAAQMLGQQGQLISNDQRTWLDKWKMQEELKQRDKEGWMSFGNSLIGLGGGLLTGGFFKGKVDPTGGRSADEDLADYYKHFDD